MKGIGATIGIAVAGLFVGAIIWEIVHRARPKLVQEIGDSTRRTFKMIGSAFMEGYRSKKGTVEEW